MGCSKVEDGRISGCFRVWGFEGRIPEFVFIVPGDVLGGWMGSHLLRSELQKAGSEAKEMALKCLELRGRSSQNLVSFSGT